MIFCRPVFLGPSLAEVSYFPCTVPKDLTNLGFDEGKVKEALKAIGNPGDKEAAINWFLGLWRVGGLSSDVNLVG